jgi:hypothetical protein
MEPKGSVPSLQDLTTVPCPEPDRILTPDLFKTFDYYYYYYYYYMTVIILFHLTDGISPCHPWQLVTNIVTKKYHQLLLEFCPKLRTIMWNGCVISWQGPHRAMGPARVPHSGKLRLLVPLKLPSVGLLHICIKPMQAPGQVGRVHWKSGNTGEVHFVRGYLVIQDRWMLAAWYI